MDTKRTFSRCDCDSRHPHSAGRRTSQRFAMDVPLIPEQTLVHRTSRCINCGEPACHLQGCPLHNPIPDLSTFLNRSEWRRACDLLHSANNFPEITGRVCPAPCEDRCAEQAESGVPIRQLEYQIAECGFANGWIRPSEIDIKSGKRVVVVGSGPAGLTAAQQLVRLGHEVIVFEKDEHIGGLLRYGIPDFKFNKSVLDRRVYQLQEEGVRFVTGIVVGEDISPGYLRKMCDAVCVAIGAGAPRDLEVPGRNLENIRQGTEYLRQKNMIASGQGVDPDRAISARDKAVAVIGGGETGDDCVATAQRDGAKKIYQLEIQPQDHTNGHRSQSGGTSHDDIACVRRWGVRTTRFSGFDKKVNELHAIEVKWPQTSQDAPMRHVVGTEFVLQVDLVLLAMGFKAWDGGGIVGQIELKSRPEGNLAVEHACGDGAGIFATGDAVMGASLVGRAIASGREVAGQIDQFLAR